MKNASAASTLFAVERVRSSVAVWSFLDGAFWLVSYMTLAAAVVNGEGQEKELTKYHVRDEREASASATGARQKKPHGRRVINGSPAVSKKKTSLARERVEERSRCKGYSHSQRLERRRDVHAIHAVQDLLRDAGVRHALEPGAGHVPEAGLGDVSQARLRRII